MQVARKYEKGRQPMYVRGQCGAEIGDGHRDEGDLNCFPCLGMSLDSRYLTGGIGRKADERNKRVDGD